MRRLRLQQLWRDFEFDPDDAQKRAILHVDGPLYLPAGPGSGKTRVLLWRTLNLIVFHDVRPDEIYLGTFTEKAALQLRDGLKTLLSAATNATGTPYDIARMYVGTVHGLCQRILTDRNFFPDRQRPRSPLLLDDLDQYLRLSRSTYWAEMTEEAGFSDAERELNTLLRGYASPSRHSAVSATIGLFNRLSEECVDPDNAARRAGERSLKRLLRLYGLYRDGLSNDRGVSYTDFALLQRRALDVLAVYDGSSRVFRHVMVDEYQDTNTIQERIFFRLASGFRNICVVGDDDQALYRFRGATVENFVQFPTRCRSAFGVVPTIVPLVTNYRSRRRIVSLCEDFMEQCDWACKPEKRFYRVKKKIVASRRDAGLSVVASSPGGPEEVCEEIAKLVTKLIRAKRVGDPNQIAFLYPSLKSTQVGRMADALEAEGVRVYAPRAKAFLEGDETTAMLGLMALIFGRPKPGDFASRDYLSFHGWLDRAVRCANLLVAKDRLLALFVADRRKELRVAARDYELLTAFAKTNRWSPQQPYRPAIMKGALQSVAGISRAAQKSLASARLDRVVAQREQDKNPLALEYVLRRASSIDWTVLDLFYRLCGFKYFIRMFDVAQRAQDPDEGPVANLALLSDYLSRFVDQRVALIAGPLLLEERFTRVFFGSYLYALYKRGETEDEDEEDPFPKGRIPFLTIHQAKGLEFPVVVLGNPRKADRGPQRNEEIVRPLLSNIRGAEPLDRVAEFDAMRMFYVALSRAKNLLVIPEFRGSGQHTYPAIKDLLDELPRIPELKVTSLPQAGVETRIAPSTYSYTGDYLAYQRCPRQYMVFRQFDFAPSRSQTMVFGTLVHKTMDDLHQFLIGRRRQA